MFRSNLTPAEKAAKEQRKARERAERQAAQERADRLEAQRRAERRAAQERADRARAVARQERFDAMPYFMVRETREVRVKASNMQDAIALAACAFKEGQDSDGGIKWRKPFGVEGDTVEPIRVVNVKAIED